MSDGKDFEANMDSDARRTPIRVAFVTRRKSPHVKAEDPGDSVMAFPEALFRASIAIEVLTIVLVAISLLWDAPLEELADPTRTPNPAKAPWYFLGLQELLHYFPPVVAGVIIPALVTIALIVIPYFRINIGAEGLWTRDRAQRRTGLAAVTAVLSLVLVFFQVWVMLVPTLAIAGLMFFSSTTPSIPGRFHRRLVSKPLSFWIMTWFLIESGALTVVGTFFRGPGWSFVWPWGQI